VLAVFVDFSKAFDTVSHELLIKKLLTKFKNKIDPYMVKILQNYFCDRQFRIKNGNYLSKYFDIKAGSGAGSALGPILFSLFINDLDSAINLPFLLYADDLVFFTEFTNLQDGLLDIENCYKKLKLWCSENNLKINVDKTKSMFFYKEKDYRSKNIVQNINEILLDGENIDVVSNFKYLGVNIDSTLQFTQHYETVLKKVVVALKKLGNIKRFFTPKLLKCLISCFAVSIFDYCLIIWSVQTDTKLQNIQTKIDKFLFSYYYPRLFKSNNKNNASSRKVKVKQKDLLGMADLLTINERRSVSLLRFVIRNRHNDLFKTWFPFDFDNPYAKFKLDKPNNEKYKHSVKWCCHVQWNEMVQKCKPDVELCVNSFIGLCKTKLIEKRIDIFM
jgi:hypothetical protein